MSTGKKKQMLGVVVSDKMQSTVVVQVKNKRKQDLYGKFVVRSQKVMADIGGVNCKAGDSVLIESCSPISKNKSWIVVQVLNS